MSLASQMPSRSPQASSTFSKYEDIFWYDLVFLDQGVLLLMLKELLLLPLLSSPQERNDVEVEKVKSTLILCYGHVALNAPPEKILTRIDQDRKSVV